MLQRELGDFADAPGPLLAVQRQRRIRFGIGARLLAREVMRLAFFLDRRLEIGLHALKAFDCGLEGAVSRLPKRVLDGSRIVFKSDRCGPACEPGETSSFGASADLVCVIERI